MNSNIRKIAVSALFGLSFALAPMAHAAVIMGEASISGQFVPLTTFTDNTSPVQISESSTIMGTPTGTVLGQVRVNGDDNGFFRPSIMSPNFRSRTPLRIPDHRLRIFQ
jgi:hypothetical protein